jgi:signal transduction histidine kinase
MKLEDKPVLEKGLMRCSQAASLLIAALSFFTLAAWAFRWMPVLQPFQNTTAMVPFTACLFLLCGLGLWILQDEGASSAARTVARGCGLGVVVGGGLVIGEYVVGRDLGIDLLLFRDAILTLPTPNMQSLHPGRPSILTAFNFLLLGLALFFMDQKGKRAHKPSEIFAFIGLQISFLALIGYACDVPLFYGWATLVPGPGMAFNTLVSFLLLGLGLLCARPRDGLMEIITSRSGGGIMARRILLAPVLIPLATGILKAGGKDLGIYDEEVGPWLFAFLNILVFAVLVWWVAGRLHRTELVREEAEEEIRRLNRDLERRVEERTAELGRAMEAVRTNEERVRKLNATLEDRVRERTEELESFSYSVSHDLRAPLRHIDGFVDMLRRDKGSSFSPSGARYLDVISKAARQMGTLIDDLLVFSRTGRSEMHSAPVKTGELVGEVIREMAPELKDRKIVWEIGELPDVEADRAMLKQVWFNLISNAVKYTRKCDEACIWIEGRRNGDGACEFSVRDNGAGFDMKYAGKLFGVFQRLHQADEFEGTGIGLANVRRIVLRHGGRTRAEGETGKGAAFYFTIPKPEPKETS